MTRASLPAVAIAASLLAACGGGPATCDGPTQYLAAVPGKRVEPLDGMDPLDSDQEMTIPDASPGAPPPPGRCLDAPPTLNTDKDKDKDADKTDDSKPVKQGEDKTG